MGTKIEWATETWNPVTGCTPISEGCQNCYAARMARRLAGRYGYPGGDGFAVTLHPERLGQPLKWQKPRRIFVCSMGDLFHPDVPIEFISEIWTRMSWDPCPNHKFIILTKRPERMREVLTQRNYFPHHIGYDYLLNVGLGVTAENQERADERIPVLLSIPAAVHFVSVEPCLGPVDLHGKLTRHLKPGVPLFSYRYGFRAGLDWVILGCETGPGRRAMLLRWARDVKDQCQAAGVPFFFKQAYNNEGKLVKLPELDGRKWEQYPEEERRER